MILILFVLSQSCLPTLTAVHDEDEPSTSPRSMASIASVDAG
jgi:hypothetical protein